MAPVSDGTGAVEAAGEYQQAHGFHILGQVMREGGGRGPGPAGFRTVLPRGKTERGELEHFVFNLCGDGVRADFSVRVGSGAELVSLFIRCGVRFFTQVNSNAKFVPLRFTRFTIYLQIGG